MPRNIDEDDDKPKKQKPLPGPLLATLLLSLAGALIGMLYFAWRLVSVVQILIDLADDPRMHPEREIAFTRGCTITLTVFYSLLLITAILSLIGAILLARRSARGTYLVVGAPGAAGIIALASTITVFVFARTSGAYGLLLLGFLLTLVLATALCVYNSFVAYKRKNTKVLR